MSDELAEARKRIAALEAALVRACKLAWCVAIDTRNGCVNAELLRRRRASASGYENKPYT